MSLLFEDPGCELSEWLVDDDDGKYSKVASLELIMELCISCWSKIACRCGNWHSSTATNFPNWSYSLSSAACYAILLSCSIATDICDNPLSDGCFTF